MGFLYVKKCVSLHLHAFFLLCSVLFWLVCIYFNLFYTPESDRIHRGSQWPRGHQEMASTAENKRLVGPPCSGLFKRQTFMGTSFIILALEKVCFYSVYAPVEHAWVPVGFRRGSWIPQSGSSSSERAVSAVICWPNSPFPCPMHFLFIYRYNEYPNKIIDCARINTQEVYLLCNVCVCVYVFACLHEDLSSPPNPCVLGCLLQVKHQI